MNLELRHLRYFVAVAEELHFTRAARRLHMAQPALSARIRDMERAIGVELVRRTTRSVELTPAGAALLDEARTALAAAERGVEAARRAARGETGHLSIGLILGTQTELTSRVLAAFSERYPDVRLDLAEHDFSDPSAGLNSGSVDLAFLVPPLQHEGLCFETLQEDARLAVLASGHPLESRPSLSVRDLFREPWIVAETDDRTCRDFWLATEHRSEPPILGPTTRSLDKFLQLVTSGQVVGLAVAWTRPFFARPGVALVPVHDVAPAAVALAWPGSTSNPAIPRFVEVARAVRDGRDGQPRGRPRPT